MVREYLDDCPDCQRYRKESKSFAAGLAEESSAIQYDELDNNQLLEKFTDAIIDKKMFSAVDLRRAVLRRMVRPKNKGQHSQNKRTQ